MPEAAMPGKPSYPKQQPMMGADAAPAYADLPHDPGHALIDALAHFAALYPGDIAYLHGVGPEVAPADGEASADGGAETVPRARWSMLGMRAYRRSHDLDDCDDDGALWCATHDAGQSDDGSNSMHVRRQDAAAGDDSGGACSEDNESHMRAGKSVGLGAIGYLGYDVGCDGAHAIGESTQSQWRWFDRWILEDHATGVVTAIALAHLGSAADSLRELRGQWDQWLDTVRGMSAGAGIGLDARGMDAASGTGPDASEKGPNHDGHAVAATPIDMHPTGGSVTHAEAGITAMTKAMPARSVPACSEPVRSMPAEATIAGADQNRASYMAAVEHMQRHMRDGDIYVANMSMRMDVRTSLAPIDAFANLYADNPSPYAAYLDFRGGARSEGNGSTGKANQDASEANPRATTAGEHPQRPQRADGPIIVGSSPERFLRIWDGKAVTEPIKGTRPRGRTAGEDAALAADLHTNAKEQAELLMVTDLERNDMNRFCEPGSVAVPAYEEVRAFPHVFHTVSVVEGRPRAGLGVADALRVMSPGGSITGTPKRRAMEIIGECERSSRGVYTGSLGYVGVDPAAWLGRLRAAHSSVSADCLLPQVCDLSIVIRTAVMTGECGARGATEVDARDGVADDAHAGAADELHGSHGCGAACCGARSSVVPDAPDAPDAAAQAVPRWLGGESHDAHHPSLYTYRIGAGGGVTLESDPAAEWDEAVHKARAVLAALGVRPRDVEALREGRTPRA